MARKRRREEFEVASVKERERRSRLVGVVEMLVKLGS
jgi:hypothetical protein